jgi:hypothetical protein
MLANRLYLDDVAFRDVVAENAHPALVDPDLFGQCQRISTPAVRPPPSGPQPTDPEFSHNGTGCGAEGLEPCPPSAAGIRSPATAIASSSRHGAHGSIAATGTMPRPPAQRHVRDRPWPLRFLVRQ